MLYPVDAEIVAPVGMSVEDEGELEGLLQMADANRDGDEQAAIERLVTILDTARSQAEDGEFAAT
ncbi:MAG TPA: hypothetical protein VGR22_08700 [Thermomicrobiales bacterium]|nr:hypothetical protein [Thermomicrobiales bacterium]